MSKLKGKIDFVLLISATNANPNGDPLNGNRPRENFDGYGEISDVCIKRKIRNRLQDMGQKIFVQSDDRADDGYGSLRERAEGCESLKTEMCIRDRRNTLLRSFRMSGGYAWNTWKKSMPNSQTRAA